MPLAESVTSVEREQMQARLEAAKRLLEMMPEPQWATVDKSWGYTVRSRPCSHKESESGFGRRRQAQMARQFWSIAIDAKKRRQQWIDDEPSDVEFYGQENEFFEKRSQVRSGTGEKMIFADYPGHIIAGLLLIVSAVVMFFAFRCSELQKATPAIV